MQISATREKPEVNQKLINAKKEFKLLLKRYPENLRKLIAQVEPNIIRGALNDNRNNVSMKDKVRAEFSKAIKADAKLSRQFLKGRASAEPTSFVMTKTKPGSAHSPTSSELPKRLRRRKKKT